MTQERLHRLSLDLRAVLHGYGVEVEPVEILLVVEDIISKKLNLPA